MTVAVEYCGKPDCENGHVVHPAKDGCDGYYPNESGITPLDLVALVFPDPVESVTKGGIIIPETTQDKQKYHTQKATLVAVGKSCFVQWVEKPKAGDRVLIVQYAGTLIKGKDGKEYRIVREDDIIAGLEE